MNRLAQNAIGWTEQGLVPDLAIRAGIRRLLAKRLEEIHAHDVERAGQALETFISQMLTAEVAPLPQLANEQHYEVPAGFFTKALGSHRKYSCCYWPADVETLDQAEKRSVLMLDGDTVKTCSMLPRRLRKSRSGRPGLAMVSKNAAGPEKPFEKAIPKVKRCRSVAA